MRNSGDVLVGISTSGNSKNVCLALESARKMGAFTAALTGEGGGAMLKIAEVKNFRVPSRRTPLASKRVTSSAVTCSATGSGIERLCAGKSGDRSCCSLIGVPH